MKSTNLFFLTIAVLLQLSFSTIEKGKTPADSYVRFSVKNAGITVNGKFKSFTTNIRFNKADIGKSIFNGVINIASIDTDIKKRDEHLKKEEFFDAAKHTGILFISTGVTSLNSNTLKVTGNLTIKATTKPIIMNVTYSTKGENTIFESKLNLNRLDYKVGKESIIMSNDISVDLKFSVKTSTLK